MRETDAFGVRFERERYTERCVGERERERVGRDASGARAPGQNAWGEKNKR